MRPSNSIVAAHRVLVPPSYSRMVRSRCVEPVFDHVEIAETKIEGIGPTTLIMANGAAGPHEDRSVFERGSVILTLSLCSGWWFGTFHRNEAAQVRFEKGTVGILFGHDLHWLQPTEPRFASRYWRGLQWVLPSRQHVRPLLDRIVLKWGGELVGPDRWLYRPPQ